MDSVLTEWPAFRKAWEYESVIPTGFLNLDQTLATGGIPSGCIVELSGPMSSGKSTICQHIIAESQKQGGWCALIDTDQAWEPRFARQCGVDLSRLLVCKMDDLASALETLSILVKSGALSLIVLDSISPFHPLSLQPGGQGIGHDSLDELVSKALRQIFQAVWFFQTAVVMACLTVPRSHPIYRELAQQTSRLALKMHASIRIRLEPLCEDAKTRKAGAFRVRANIIKNSFNPCQQFVDLDIM